MHSLISKLFKGLAFLTFVTNPGQGVASIRSSANSDQDIWKMLAAKQDVTKIITPSNTNSSNHR